MKSDPSPALIVIGGTQAFITLAQKYALLNGWKRVETIETNTLRIAELIAWREAMVARLVGSTSSGERIVILSDHPYVYDGWARRVMLAGRKVDIPLDGLTPVECLLKVNCWLARKESGRITGIGRNPLRYVRNMLKSFVRVLLKKHPTALQSSTPVENKEEGR